jgi:hypothetical protein
LAVSRDKLYQLPLLTARIIIIILVVNKANNNEIYWWITYIYINLDALSRKSGCRYERSSKGAGEEMRWRWASCLSVTFAYLHTFYICRRCLRACSVIPNTHGLDGIGKNCEEVWLVWDSNPSNPAQSTWIES